MTFTEATTHTSQASSSSDLASLSGPTSVPRLNINKPIRFIDNIAFRDADAWARIVESPYPTDSTVKARKTVLGDELTSLVAAPVLSKAQERYLFLKMNFLKHEAEIVRQQIAAGTRHPSAVSEISNFLASAVETRNLIVASNTRLIVFSAKKYVTPTNPITHLVSEGSDVLIRATNHFDCDQGIKFSTYASTSLFRFYARAARTFERSAKPRFLSEFPDVTFPDPKSQSTLQQVEYRSLKEKLGEVIAQLPPRDALIIRQRFFEDATFQDVAYNLGISKQRVQQIQVEVLDRLRILIGDRFEHE